MLVIYTMRTDVRAVQVRARLLDAGIPCALVGPEYGNAALVHKVPFVYFGRECKPIADGFEKTVPAYRILPSYDSLTPELLTEYARTLYGMDYYNLSRGGIQFVNDVLHFFGNRILLTDRERCIVKLLSACPEIYFTAEEIAALCLDAGGDNAVKVHISHINSKNVSSVHDKIIYSKRFYGYYVK